MPVGRPCSLHGFNWALCELYRAHQGTCGYSPEGEATPPCTGFQPCDPTAICTCDKCQTVTKLKDLAWKCEEVRCDFPDPEKPGVLSICGHIDSELPLLRASCPRCGQYDMNKVGFFTQCVTKGLITPEAYLKANEEWINSMRQGRDRHMAEYKEYLKAQGL